MVLILIGKFRGVAKIVREITLYLTEVKDTYNCEKKRYLAAVFL